MCVSVSDENRKAVVDPEEHCTVYTQFYLTFRGPCIVIYSYDKSQQDALFLNFILV